MEFLDGFVCAGLIALAIVGFIWLKYVLNAWNR